MSKYSLFCFYQTSVSGRKNYIAFEVFSVGTRDIRVWDEPALHLLITRLERDLRARNFRGALARTQAAALEEAQQAAARLPGGSDAPNVSPDSSADR